MVFCFYDNKACQRRFLFAVLFLKENTSALYFFLIANQGAIDHAKHSFTQDHSSSWETKSICIPYIAKTLSGLLFKNSEWGWHICQSFLLLSCYQWVKNITNSHINIQALGTTNIAITNIIVKESQSYFHCTWAFGCGMTVHWSKQDHPIFYFDEGKKIL